MTSREMGFWYWVIAHLIPKRIIYFSFMHVMAHATTGKHGNTVVPELTGMDAIKRYGDDNDLWAPPR